MFLCSTDPDSITRNTAIHDRTFAKLVLFLAFVLKNTISIQEILYFGIIAVVRYLFIFSVKNPATFQDEFWSFFINILVISFGFLSQVLFACLPGRQPLTFYFCTGDIPSGL
jgi:hypothetical protein